MSSTNYKNGVAVVKRLKTTDLDHKVMKSLNISALHQMLLGWSNQQEWDGQGM
jgi:hypothetical protein